MNDPLAAPEGRLIDALAAEARGPRRNGAYALWLVLRVAAGALPPDRLPRDLHAERLAELGRRLSSLSLPVPLRRALTGALAELEEASPAASAAALRLLVAPARETLGPPVADAVAVAAREARTLAQPEPSA